MNIPKESSPSVKLGTIMISTVYPGTSPVDIDTLISDKIYKEIKSIKGIDKITTSSSLGISMLTASLKTSADTKEVLNDIRNSVNKVSLPSDAKTPTITEIETDTNRTFSVFLYSKNPDTSRAVLFDRAIHLQKEVEKGSGIDSVEITAW
jgi:multidrug efflux pump